MGNVLFTEMMIGATIGILGFGCGFAFALSRVEYWKNRCRDAERAEDNLWSAIQGMN